MPLTLVPFPPTFAGVSQASRPQLAGTILDDRAQRSQYSKLPYIAHTRIVRSQRTGLLDFYFQFTFPSGAPAETYFEVSNFSCAGLKITYADWRNDLGGTLAIKSFALSPVGPGFSLDFPYAATRVLTQTRFCFVSTNARVFAMTQCLIASTDGSSLPLRIPGPSSIAPAL